MFQALDSLVKPVDLAAQSTVGQLHSPGGSSHLLIVEFQGLSQFGFLENNLGVQLVDFFPQLRPRGIFHQTPVFTVGGAVLDQLLDSIMLSPITPHMTCDRISLRYGCILGPTDLNGLPPR
jgi:hypothetical protein